MDKENGQTKRMATVIIVYEFMVPIQESKEGKCANGKPSDKDNAHVRLFDLIDAILSLFC